MDKSRKKNRSLFRNEPKREAYDLVLIVCEGTKTEPFYFKSLREFEKLSSVNIEIISGKGTDPVSVVKTAKEAEEKQAQYLPFDKVYCVIDRDAHKKFAEAEKTAKENDIELVVSYPSFEYWYLCHFVCSRSSFVSNGKGSAGDNCEKQLNEHWQKEFKATYTKNLPDIYHKLYDRLDTALRHARSVLQQSEADNQPNPSTKAHILVDYLRNIRKANELEQS